MYTVSEVVEIGTAQDMVRGQKGFDVPEDVTQLGPISADEFDE